jgi:hypothetical protein
MLNNTAATLHSVYYSHAIIWSVIGFALGYFVGVIRTRRRGGL